jgi:2'-5' RNA ligase
MSAHEYSSTQFGLPDELAKRVREAGAKIPDWALAEEGRETEPHVTLKYGLHSGDPDSVRNVIEAQKPFTVRLGKTSHFPDSGSGDVVKVDVHSPELHALNKKVADATPHTDTHPDYHPHATLAYVKAGMGPHFVKADGHSLEGKEAIVDHIIFSSKDGKKTKIALKGEEGRKVGVRYRPMAMVS